MAMDRVDGVALVAICGLLVISLVLENALGAAMLGGFLLSLSVWRLYDGRPWEALGWIAWVGATVVLIVGTGGPATAVAFAGFTVAGIGMLFGSRFGLFPDAWTVDRDGT
ncbi:hypothetical protein [Halopiger djelfimassiliensis]|uniref:hypothetical protein n=1 Tax=Halopiger djelfimassiliensis TaxID=1293047 RepID=UPI000677F458|nr:hypothetical protein [Halopiger djelfimassiliensis]